MTDILSQFYDVKARIDATCVQEQRKKDDVDLIAVSKTFPTESIQAVYNMGQRHFGENYIQEWVDKVAQLPDDIVWHIIGPLQSNKTKVVAEKAQWFHTLDRIKIAQRLSQQRPASLPDLNVCIEVNISQEKQKHGIAAVDLEAFARSVELLPHLKIRGLMCIPSAHDSCLIATQMQTMQQLFLDMQGKGFSWDTLSMGMSADLEIAIRYGATQIRVGSAIFGTRIDTNK